MTGTISFKITINQKKSGRRLTTELFGQPCKSEDQLEIIPRAGTQTALDWFNDFRFLSNYLKSFGYSYSVEIRMIMHLYTSIKCRLFKYYENI